jgi:outer membrane lipoprotein-sorting protein
MLRHLLATLAVTALVPVAASAQTADELIAKNLAAKGGLEKIKAVQTMRVSGTMPVGQGVEAPFVMEMKRPNQMRLDVNYQGMTATQAFDGTIGWQVMPSSGRRAPQVLPQEAVKQFASQADMDGPLVDYQAKGHTIEYVGREKVEGTDTYLLKVTLKSGEVNRIFLDAEQYLEIRSEGKSRGPTGGEMEIETLIGDYREVAGLMLPHLRESGPKGGTQKIKMTIQKVEVNVPLDDARFKMPK